METNVAMKTNKEIAPTTYGRIRKWAKAMEKDIMRFLSNLVRAQSFSSEEKNVIAAIKKEMHKIGFDGIRIDGLGKQPFVDGWTFSTNGIATAGMKNIPTFGLGPGNEVYAHAANEACPVEHLSAAVAFYAAFVAKLNGKI